MGQEEEYRKHREALAMKDHLKDRPIAVAEEQEVTEEDIAVELGQARSREQQINDALVAEIARGRALAEFTANVQLTFTQDALRAVASMPPDRSFLKQRRALAVWPDNWHRRILRRGVAPLPATGLFSGGFGILNHPDALRDADLTDISVVLIRSETELRPEVERKLLDWVRRGGILYLHARVRVVDVRLHPEPKVTSRWFAGMAADETGEPGPRQGPIPRDVPLLKFAADTGAPAIKAPDGRVLCARRKHGEGCIIWNAVDGDAEMPV